VDPITTAIIFAVSKLGEMVINDGYNALKAILRRKWGANSELMNAVEQVEKKPESLGRQNTLHEEVLATNAHKDAEALKIAQELLNIMQVSSNISIPNAQQTGDRNILVGQIVGRDINIVQGADKPNAASLLRRGVEMISLCAYEQAIAAFRQAIDAEPSASEAYYYLALSQLRGKRPMALSYSEAEAITQHLKTACRLDGQQAHFLYLWALVKLDFYINNGFEDRPPYIEDLLDSAEHNNLNQPVIRQLLEHVGAEDSQVTAHIRRRLRS
jgi:tetratricopeptide (TPR) repeat protein